jgi:antitoxin component YwqK of YwqJK toxin-antitoxin module
MRYFIITICLFCLAFQDPNWSREVMRKHPNGQPYVVMFFDQKSQKMMREEVYFTNGKLQWEGNYKNQLEDGKWVYYYESGVVKSVQYYTKGKENGICSDYDMKGKLVKESTWVNGKEVKVVKH